MWLVGPLAFTVFLSDVSSASCCLPPEGDKHDVRRATLPDPALAVLLSGEAEYVHDTCRNGWNEQLPTWAGTSCIMASVLWLMPSSLPGRLRLSHLSENTEFCSGMSFVISIF